MWALLCLSSACATSTTASVLPQARTAAQLPLRVFDKTPSGMSIASLPRATPNVVRLALYLDAGSRDATLPETATLSAWLAAASAGPAVEAVVYPDATELTLTCNTTALADCVDQLARALAFRTPAPDALSSARSNLRDGQRRALAQEPLSGLDQLALRALLGDGAPQFFPLGKVDSDLVAAGDAVPQFLTEHYGPKRALLVAAGDVEPNKLRELAETHFAHAPNAVLSRTTRSLVPLEAPKLSVSFEERGALAFALTGTDLASLNDVTHELRERVGSLASLSAYVFPARSGALALLHLQAADPELALDRVVRELSRLAVEEQREHTTLMPRDDLGSASRELGFDFASGGATAPAGIHFAAALALPAGADPGPAGQGQRSELENKRREHAQSTFERALAQLSPKLKGDSDEYAAAVTLENGAHLDVQFSQGSAVALSIRVGLGAEQDPALAHGQAALLATLTTTACAGMGPELLHSRFAQLGATLEPRVDGESYGVLLRVPTEHFEAAADLARRCVRTPSRDPRYLVEAGVQLQQRLRKLEAPLSLRARAANLLSPRAPGALAPWGDPERIPNVHPKELEQLLQRIAYAELWAVAAVGPLPVRSHVTWLARRLADLASGTPPKAARFSEPSAVLPSELPRSKDGTHAKALAVWTARGAFQSALGAQLFSRALASMFSAVPGVEVLWHDADSYKETSFVALALRMRADLVLSLPNLLAGAAHNVDDAWLERALEPAIKDAKSAQSAAQAQFAVRAERTARLRLGGAFGAPKLDDARKQLQVLRDGRPGFAPLP